MDLLRGAISRLFFAGLFLGGGGALIWWFSPLETAELEVTVIKPSVWQPGAPSPWRAQPDWGYDIIFWAEGYFCVFRYYVWHPGFYWINGGEQAETALADGDRITVRYRRSTWDYAEEAFGRDCKTGRPLPGSKPRLPYGHQAMIAKIEVVDLYRDGSLVMNWLAGWASWGVLGAVLTIPGLLILFAPLIDAIDRRRRRHGPGYPPRFPTRTTSTKDRKGDRDVGHHDPR